MDRIKRLSTILSILIFMVTVSPASYTNASAAEIESQYERSYTNQGVRLQDDFYDAINNQWINEAKIEDGKSTASTFDDVERKVTEQMKELINNLLINKDKYKENSDEKKIINMYNNTLNMEARNGEGLKPVQKNLDEIKAAKTIDDITKLWFNKEILNSTIKFYVDRDIKNATTNILYISSTGLSLGDSDEYTAPIESTIKNKKLTEEYYNKILVLSGYTQEEAKVKVYDMFKFEGMVAPYIMGKQEKLATSNLIDAIYNVYTLDELNNLAPNLNLPAIMGSLGLDKANKIILQDPIWLRGLNEIYVQENLNLIKNYLEIINLAYASNYLNEDLEDANEKFYNSLSGSTGDLSKEEDAINAVNENMGMAVGKIYAEKYISQKTKEDVENITKDIITTYKKRINNLDWMSESTKKNAINKLDKLNVRIGYPQKWDDYSTVNIKSYEEGGSLFQNMMLLRIYTNDDMFGKINKPVDKEAIVFTPQTVNAFYSATENSIIIPGGIIQGHFYDPNKTVEENLGGIGVIIGHEISHAFDTNGAQYDSDGNLKNWWSEIDYKRFINKGQEIADFYNKIEVSQNEKINGYLTVEENIADIGGVSCLLDILDTMDNPNYKVFFESYATTWRKITTKEFAEYALRVDVHSPNKFRVNGVLPQFQKFYDTYQITEDDDMYVKPINRVGIW